MDQQTDTSDMAAVHRAIVGALETAPSYLGAATTPERAEVLASFYDNVIEFLHVHHEGEDAILYPLLEERCPHEKGGLEEIDAQHRLLDVPMTTVREAIATYRAAPTTDHATALVDAIAAVDRVLTPHLADEEALVVPLASEHLTPEEWGQLPGHALGNFQRDKPWVALGLVVEQLDASQLAQMQAGMPPPVLELWTTQWSPMFETFIAEVRG
jgi:hemerythrin-like domain-containing protein